MTLPAHRDLPVPTESEAGQVDRRRIIVSVVLALTVLLAVDLACVAGLSRWERTSDPHVLVTRERWATILARPAPAEVLVAGDSSGLHGVDARMVGAALGGEGENVCAFGDLLLMNTLWLCEELEQRRAMPRVLVLVHVVEMWPRKGGVVARQLGLIPDGFKRAAASDPPVPVTWRQRADWEFDHLVPIIGRHSAVQAMIGQSIGAANASSRRVTPDGTIRLSPDPDNVIADGAKVRRNLGKSAWQASAINQAAMRRLLAVCASSGTTVLYMHAPVFEGLATTPEFRSALQAANAWLHGIESEHPGFHVLAEEPSTFPAASMQNADHIATPESVAVFSGRIVELAKGFLANGASAPARDTSGR